MSLISALKQHFTPLSGVMTLSDYRSVRRIQPLTKAKTRIKNHEVMISDAPGFIHSASEIFRDHVYHFNSKSDRPHIIDAGSNIGLSILYFKDLYPNSTVIGYEPDPNIFSILKHNVGSLPGVELRQAAAWTEDTELIFYSEGSLAGSTTIDTEMRHNTTSVVAEKLSREIDNAHVDFLKIDIEGAENHLLFDIKPYLKNVDNLFFEYHSITGHDQKLGDMLNLVKESGFRYVLNGAHGPKLPFTERVDKGFDLQINVSCFRS